MPNTRCLPNDARLAGGWLTVARPFVGRFGRLVAEALENRLVFEKEVCAQPCLKNNSEERNFSGG
jgi:hypothetical protein